MERSRLGVKLRAFSLLPLGLALLVGQGCGGSDKSSAKDITSFAFQASSNAALAADVSGTISGTSIALTVPNGTAVNSLTPTIALSAGATVSPASGAAQDFTNSVTYTVTAADGSTKAYTVTVTVAPSSAKDITSFAFLAADNSGLASDVTGTVGGTHVAVALAGTSTTPTLIPTIAVSAGATVSPASGVAQDFGSSTATPVPVTYTVTAADSSTKQYVVSVTTSTTQKNITLFSINGVDGTVASTGNSTGTITLTLPSGTDLHQLTPTIALTSGATIDVASGVARDFTGSVTYSTNNPAATNQTPKVWTVMFTP